MRLTEKKKNFRTLSEATGIGYHTLWQQHRYGKIPHPRDITEKEIKELAKKNTGRINWGGELPFEEQKRSFKWLSIHTGIPPHKLIYAYDLGRIKHPHDVLEEDIELIKNADFRSEIIVPLNFVELEKITRIFRQTLYKFHSEGRIKHPQDMLKADIDELIELGQNYTTHGSKRRYVNRPPKGRYEVVFYNFKIKSVKYVKKS